MTAARKRTPMTEDKLRTLIDHRIAQSIGSGRANDAVTASRLKAMKYYKGEPLGDEREGASKVISRDVAEAVDGMMPSLMKIFSSGDVVGKFSPSQPGLEAQAKQRTDYANWIWAEQNPGFGNFDSWFRDALLQRLGVVKCWWDDKVHLSREQYEGLTDAEFHELLADPDLELAEHDEYPDPDPLPPQMPQLPAPAPGPMGQNSPTPAPQAGSIGPGPMAAAPGGGAPPIPLAPPPMLHDAVFRRRRDESQVRIVPVPPDECLIASRSGATDLPWGNFRRTTASDLCREFPAHRDAIMNLPTDDKDLDAERIERFRDEGMNKREDSELDPSQRELWVADCYFNVDFDGDGYAEFRKVTTAGATSSTTSLILENVEYDDNPFCPLTPIPLAHKLIGMSVADQTMDLQEIKTTLIRQGLDNVYRQNGSEVAITGKWDLDAWMNRRPGNVIRGEQGATFEQIQATPMLGDIMMGVQYFDGVRDQRTGAPRNQAGPGADSLDNAYTQTLGGANLVETASQEKIAYIARVFAETGVKRVFQRIDELVCKHQQKAKMLRLRGQWVEMNPLNWKTKMDCTVTVGLGTNNKTTQVNQLLGLLTQVYAPLVQMQQGLNGPIVTPQSLHVPLIKTVEAMGFKDAQEFFPDPQPMAAAPPPPPDPSIQVAQIRAQSDAAKTVHTTQVDQQKLMLQLQSQERVAQLNAAVERELGYAKIAVDNKAIDTEVELKKRQHETDTAFKAHDAHLDARASDREDRAASLEEQKAAHDAQHDTAELTQKGDQFQTSHKATTEAGEREFQAKNPNYQPPSPRKLIKIGLTHDADGLVSGAKRHFDDGTVEDLPIARQKEGSI